MQTVTRSVRPEGLRKKLTSAHIAQLAILPLPCIAIEFERLLVDRLGHSVQNEIPYGRLLHRVWIVLASKPVQSSLPLLLVAKDAQEVAFVGKEEFDSHISEQKRPLV